MSLATSKTCLIAVINSLNKPFLNFVTQDFITRINASINFTDLYSIVVQLNTISALTLSSISSKTECSNTELQTKYLVNIATSMDIDLSSINQISLSTALNTISKSSLVDAINELRAQITPTGTITSLSSLITTDKTSLKSAINSLQSQIKSTNGAQPLSTLYTYDKSSLVAAINEIEISKFAFSLIICSLGDSLYQDSATTSPSNALFLDLGNLFVIGTSLQNSGGNCLVRLHCVMGPGGNAQCRKQNTVAIVQSKCALANSICDSTWFCNLNKFVLTQSPLVDDDNTFSKWAAKEICPEWI